MPGHFPLFGRARFSGTVVLNWCLSNQVCSGPHPLAPSPSLMERGKRCWRMAPEAACVQIWCNCGAFAPYFFYFSLISKVENMFYQEIGCNCGAFAPYFFIFPSPPG